MKIGKIVFFTMIDVANEVPKRNKKRVTKSTIKISKRMTLNVKGKRK